MGLSNRVRGQEHILSNIKTARKFARGVTDNQQVLPLVLEEMLETLLKGKIELEGLMPWSSNYTFLATLTSTVDQCTVLAIYKPCQGERPLWDFPGGTLCRREFASYLVSQVLGWPRIPPTVLRDGPHGGGSVQLFIDAEYEAHYFNMRHIPSLADEFKEIALFDFIVNNADRKGGHCLKGKDGQIWAIDHGLTFHTDFKLRTVIWEFCEEAVPALFLEDLERLQVALDSAEFCQILESFISHRELKAFKNRLERLIAAGCFPQAHAGRNIPFPPI